jgi:hypothetical protein
VLDEPRLNDEQALKAFADATRGMFSAGRIGYIRSGLRTALPPLVRGLVAGAVGTAAMTGYQTLVASFRNEGPTSPHAWKDAPAPAQVGRRVLTVFFEKKVTLEDVPWLTRAFHWGYGVAWGSVYGVLEGGSGAKPIRPAMLFGTTVWGLSYAELVPMGIYKPPWKCPARELALDLSYHLVYGVATGTAFALLGGREEPPAKGRWWRDA